MIVKIIAKKSASSRTKNRIHAHGKDGFFLKRREISSKLFENKPAILVKSLTFSATKEERWFGWLPEEEIDIEILDQSP